MSKRRQPEALPDISLKRKVPRRTVQAMRHPGVRSHEDIPAHADALLRQAADPAASLQQLDADSNGINALSDFGDRSMPESVAPPVEESPLDGGYEDEEEVFEEEDVFEEEEEEDSISNECLASMGATLTLLAPTDPLLATCGVALIALSEIRAAEDAAATAEEEARALRRQVEQQQLVMKEQHLMIGKLHRRLLNRG
jgi:hypothetical protein